ncbi:hypothetical protein HZH68_005427 [Vespula germanica]|uniref:Uncharacterized protein n=1 Tax=Vespula germanica TaxID=30212 RepID=A0A834KG50_VESGE|nr:hypothetical protein HZH68_005427 [Vespula germanica]
MKFWNHEVFLKYHRNTDREEEEEEEEEERCETIYEDVHFSRYHVSYGSKTEDQSKEKKDGARLDLSDCGTCSKGF